MKGFPGEGFGGNGKADAFIPPDASAASVALEATCRIMSGSEEVREMLEELQVRDEGGGPGHAKGRNAVVGETERTRVQERPEKRQLLSRTDMVHYVDVRDGWDFKECECCFDRAVSYRAQRALSIANIDIFRLELHNMLPASVPAAPPTHQSRADVEFSQRVPVQALGGLGGVPPLVQLEWKERNAPYQCVEAMLLEWIAEPRVGVLMDLGRIRSRLPVIFAAGDCAAHSSPTFPAEAEARFPRFVTLWKAQKELYDTAYPSLAVELGVSRQAQPDVAASTLVQVLGVKDSADLKEGFGFFVQHLLSGGLEKAHAEGKGGTGGGAAENVHADGRGRGGAARGADGVVRGSVEDIGRLKDGRMAKEVVMMPWMGSPEASWETGIRLMAEAMARAAEGRSGTAEERGSGSGVGGVAEVGNGREGAGEGGGREKTGSKEGSDGCDCDGGRDGKDSILAKQCSKDNPQAKILRMQHPFHDLPSLLLRFGAIPKPVDRASFPLEWGEWSHGDEGAVKLPEDPSARCFGLGIVEQSEEFEAREEGGSGGEVRETPPEQAAKGGGGKR
ncbi:unnamed protein product [Closterium sp. Yama58-4]|nr:unnamed protein product [Closterium sp. Yama58-4]